jgi:hypothetical protein
LFTATLSAQERYEQKWMFDNYLMLDFATEPPTVTRNVPPVYLGPGNALSSISDKFGALQFYTSGCSIYNKNDQVMENGDSINSWFILWSQCHFGFQTISMSNTILTNPADSNQYFVLNMGMDDNNYVPQYLYSHKVDMSLNNGLGRVTEKLNIVVHDSLSRGFVTAVRHVNNKDWWVVVPKDNSNCYYIIPVTSEGIGIPQLQCIGIQYGYEGSGGQVVFSPDRTKYARIEPSYVDGAQNGLAIFDFDASTGIFSNPRTFDYAHDYGFAQGVAFSGNSQYLYITSTNKIHQYDTNVADPKTTETLIAEIGPDSLNNIGVPHLMRIGPNGVIYIACLFSHKFLSTINRPNCPGSLCDFKPYNIAFETYNNDGINSLPNFNIPPQSYDCAPISSTIPAVSPKPFTLAPNPVTDILTITTDAENPVTAIQLTDGAGRAVKNWQFQAADRVNISFEGIPPGIYFCRVLSGGIWRTGKVWKSF